jgi:hypothetical protein
MAFFETIKNWFKAAPAPEAPVSQEPAAPANTPVDSDVFELERLKQTGEQVAQRVKAFEEAEPIVNPRSLREEFLDELRAIRPEQPATGNFLDELKKIK